MLGSIPLVSMSDNRLGGIENSSLRYFSAIRALEFSTSRMVRPSFSRRVRRLLPAGSMGKALQKCEGMIPKRESLCCRNFAQTQVTLIVLRNPNTLQAKRDGRADSFALRKRRDRLRVLRLRVHLVCSDFVTCKQNHPHRSPFLPSPCLDSSWSVRGRLRMTFVIPSP